MWSLIAVIAALVVVGIAALSLFTAQQLSSPTGRIARPALHDQGPPAAQPSRSMSPWPDLDDLTNDDSRPMGAASLDDTVKAHPKGDFQSPAAHMTTPSFADDGASRLPRSPPRVVPHKNERRGHAGRPRR
jgi:hypothetical protein